MIPGAYQDVEAPSEAEKKSWASLPYDEQDYLTREVGATALTGEKGYSTFEKTWARPTLGLSCHTSATAPAPSSRRSYNHWLRLAEISPSGCDDR